MHKNHSDQHRLFLAGLLGSLGDLSGATSRLLNTLDDTDSDGLAHVTDGETTERGVVGEGLDTHGLGGNHLDDGGVTGLDELRAVLNRLTGTAVDLLKELGELASNVGSVAVQDGSVTSADLTRVVKDDDLSVEAGSLGSRVVLGVGSDVTTADFLDGNVLDVETNVVTGDTLLELLVVHLNGLHFSGDVGRSEGNDHAGGDGTSLDTADRHSSNTGDLVDILEGKTEGLVGGTDGRLDGVDGLKEGLTGDLAGLAFLLPALVPGAVGGGLKHVVTVETGDGDEGNTLGVVADLLDEVGGLLNNFVVTLLGPLAGVHLVKSDDELLNTEGESKQSVLTGLAILGDTSLEFTSTGGNDEDSAVSLRGTSDHVLDEVTVTRGINDSDLILGGLELPEGNVDGDTTLTLGLELVKNPSVLEGTLTEFGGFLLELLNGTLVNTTALVDQVTGGGRLTGVDVTDNDDVKVSLVVLTHDDGVLC
jgi:hypothetical protein